MYQHWKNCSRLPPTSYIISQFVWPSSHTWGPIICQPLRGFVIVWRVLLLQSNNNCIWTYPSTGGKMLSPKQLTNFDWTEWQTVQIKFFHFCNPLKSSSMAESAGPLAPCVHACTAQTRAKRRLRTLRKLLNDRERSSLLSATWRGLHLFPGPKTEPSHWSRSEGEIRGLPETLPETLVWTNQERLSYMDLIHWTGRTVSHRLYCYQVVRPPQPAQGKFWELLNPGWASLKPSFAAWRCLTGRQWSRMRTCPRRCSRYDFLKSIKSKRDGCWAISFNPGCCRLRHPGLGEVQHWEGHCSLHQEGVWQKVRKTTLNFSVKMVMIFIRYNPTWHCIVGRNFGSYVTHETRWFQHF